MKTAIYHIRTRCNYSQSMAAREIGVSRQMFSTWEHGDKPIPDTRKQALSALFGVPVSILTEKDEAKVLAFCDRPVFTTTCCGKQVFPSSRRISRPGYFWAAPQIQDPRNNAGN